jgi:hypothetical protein
MHCLGSVLGIPFGLVSSVSWSIIVVPFNVQGLVSRQWRTCLSSWSLLLVPSAGLWYTHVTLVRSMKS